MLRNAWRITGIRNPQIPPWGPTPNFLKTNYQNSKQARKYNFSSIFRRLSPCRKRSPAKGVRQKSDEKSDRGVRKSDRKVTKSVPKTKKVIELLLPHSFCGTLSLSVFSEFFLKEFGGVGPREGFFLVIFEEFRCLGFWTPVAGRAFLNPSASTLAVSICPGKSFQQTCWVRFGIPRLIFRNSLDRSSGRHSHSLRTRMSKKKISLEMPFESKLLPAVLLLLRIYFPKITVTVTVLKFGRINLSTITVTVLASAVTFISIDSQLPSWK